ncbi:MAG: thiamine pyrophosphate-dependent enzyme [Candidatus Dormibacteraeota bacterium]|nr:thiamine pyrophosphate-dependent enzyme [Candidatus Dormibacteraeota bacterium]
MKRLECLQAIYPDIQDCAVVTIMGATSAELHSLGHRANFFYLTHAMGLASSIGLGLALCRPERQVVVLDGDGSVLMNLGGLSTMARYGPPNLLQIIFDNESLLSVGGFPTATATGTDLAACARGAGIHKAITVTTVDDFASAVREALSGGELACVVAKVEAVGPAGYIVDTHLLEDRFMFARAMREPAPRESPAEGGKMP